MNELPKLEEYLKRAEGPELFKTVSPDGQYVKFKYSEYTTYNLKWDPVTLPSAKAATSTESKISEMKIWSLWDLSFINKFEKLVVGF